MSRQITINKEQIFTEISKLIAEGKYTDALDEVILKVIHSKQKRLKVIYKEA